ncbi:MAG: PH domain-containing protein [Patescibacteria group bacterium]
MFSAITLKPDEKILMIVRQTPIAFATSFLIGLILFLLPFFLLFPLFSWGRWGVAGFCALLLGAFFFSLYQFVMWYFNCGIITNMRVIDVDQKGLTERVVSEVPYFKIDDVSYNIKGVKQTMFRYGNVVVAIKGYRSSVTLRNVGNPAVIQELILEVEREVRGWNDDERRPMEKIMGEVDKLSDVEIRALSVALKKMHNEEIKKQEE